MDIVEIQAKEFSSNVFNTSGNIFDLSYANSNLNSALFEFTRYRDKHRFMTLVASAIREQIEKHKPKCTARGSVCGFEKDREYMLFSIEQELESVSDFLEDPEIGNRGKLSGAEQVEMHKTLNDILLQLRSLKTEHDAGIELLCEEIADLKERLNYDKKTLQQLAMAKISEAVYNKVIDETVAKGIWDSLNAVLKATVNYLGMPQ